ncbi:MAG TPA: DUF4350 domain-containing protein [Gemmataceae bacterium]|nr:DUF4350 domain-containing protein [Gemmataceae bacterium]
MTRCRPAAPCALVLGLLALVIVPPCIAQRPQLPGGLKQLPAGLSPLDEPPYAQRMDAFRRLLFELRFQPLNDFADLHANPSESLLIVLGDPSCLSKGHFPKGLRDFVKQGGAVLIATDHATDGEAGEMLKQLAGVRVTGEKLHLPLGSEVYEGNPFCPLVLPITVSSPLGDGTSFLGALAALVGAGSRPSLFHAPSPDQQNFRLATNAPSQLERQRSRWGLPWGIHRLARLPVGCVEESFLIDPLGGRGSSPLFAVGGAVGKGRVLVLADHSIFINRMILPRDNGNLEFAANCLHWLRGGVSTPMEALRTANNPDALQQLTGQRNKVLFWNDGAIRTDFEVPLKTVPLKPSLGSEPAIVAAIDKTIANMEDNDYFNSRLLEGMDNLPGGRPGVVRNAIYLLTLAAVLFLGYRFLWRSRHRPEPATLVLEEAVRQHEPRVSLLEQRRRALLRSGNVWETAHRVAREWFELSGLPLTGARPPRVEMKHGSWRTRWGFKRRFARLWLLARGDAPVRIPPSALKRWLRELEELKIALRDGTIRLT